jgi:hypothetical protein
MTPTTSPNTTEDSMQVLSAEAAWIELAGASIGRLAVSTPDGPDIFPVNYTVHDELIYLRSAPGLKLQEMTASPIVAFEADGQNGFYHWSVVVRGAAVRLAYDYEIMESGVTGLHTSTSSQKLNYFRITPKTISGRLFAKATMKSR